MKRSKLNVDIKNKEKRTVDGIVFDSELEARYYKDIIKIAAEHGFMTDVKVRPKYILQDGFTKYQKVYRPVYYEADFEITYHDGEVKIIDIKGMATEAALLKRKLFDKRYHDKMLEWIAYSKKDGGWIEYDELKKLRAKRKKVDKCNIANAAQS